MGSERVTVRNLEIADVKTDQNILLIKGAIPGAIGAIVQIKKED